MKNLFFKPKNAWPGDFIPFYDNGTYWIFYLHDSRKNGKQGLNIPWHLLSTKDFVKFTYYDEVIQAGNKDDQDFNIYTGNVVKADGTYHAFYTGDNPSFPKKGKKLQAVMHAVSDNLIKWEKIPEDTFYSDESIYEKDDWRDPFVFWNEEKREFWMLLAARIKEGPSNRRGCTALCTSKDLKKWKICEPLWSPNIYYTHECPDLFKIGKWWYLIFSTFSDCMVTHYRMSKSLNGPWLSPANDSFDGRAFYAAKTASDNKRRYIFGWNPTRDKEKDYSRWDWGGNLVVHEVVQNSDGTLSVKMPDTINEAFKDKLPASFIPMIGKWDIQKNIISSYPEDSFSCILSKDEIPSLCKISSNIKFEDKVKNFGIMVRASNDLEETYYIRFEPDRSRLVFDSWPRESIDPVFSYVSDSPFWIGQERPIKLIAGTTYKVEIIIDNTICEVYVNNEIAMSTRIYDFGEGKFGFFVRDGKASFSDVEIKV